MHMAKATGIHWYLKHLCITNTLPTILFRGAPYTQLPTQVNVNESSGPIPALGGVTWVRDNAISSTTGGWAMDYRYVYQEFQGPTTAFHCRKSGTRNY